MFEVIRPHCAGIDLGSEAHYVAARDSVRRFGCFTVDLAALADWLKAEKIVDVAMEATGVLWMPVYEFLAARGFKVALVDGRAAKALPGRKTDVKDCQWIRDLHACGLLRPCLVPEAEILVLRTYWRQRQRHIEQCSEQIQLMHKAMEQMNIQLHRVLSDISGVSGMRMVRAILAGERNPDSLASLVHPRVKADKKTIAASLEGNWTEHHLFALRQAVELFDFLQARLHDCDCQIDKQMQRLGGQESGPRGKKTTRNMPAFDLTANLIATLGCDPTQINGLDAMSCTTLLAELGPDLSRFPTEKHLCSHLGLAPRNKITGGRIKSSRTARVRSRASTTLRLAAQSLANSQCAFGAFFRRIRAKHGSPKATTATARKLVVAYYNLVRYGITFDDQGVLAYEERLNQQRLRHLEKQAKKLNLQLVPFGGLVTLA